MRTQRSSPNFVGKMKYVYGTSPDAGRRTGSGISSTASGDSMFHPFAHFRSGGADLGSPIGAFASAHAARVEISCFESDGSFAKRPQQGSANQGGMIRALVCRAIARAKGRVCRYVTSGIEAISPSRWQVWQCASSIGRTSLKKVGGAARQSVANNRLTHTNFTVARD